MKTHVFSKQIGNELTMEELEEFLEKMSNEQSQGRGTTSTEQILKIKLEEKKRRPWDRLIRNKIASLQKIKRVFI